MKKFFVTTLAVVLTVCVVLCTGCSAKKTQGNFTISSDKTSVAAGEQFTVTISVSELKNIACVDCSVLFDVQKLNASSYDGIEIDDFEFFINEEPGKIVYSGYTLRTINLENNDFMTVTFTVPENAQKGEKLTVSAQIEQLLMGTDESGDQTEDIGDTVSETSVTITVK